VGNAEQLVGQRGAAGANAGAPAAAPAPTPAPDAGPPAATFGNAGAGFKDGLPYQPWAADLVKKRQADNSKDNPDAHCLPMGFLQFHNHPEPRKIIQNPGVTVIIYEANSGLRQIFTDGRTLPGKDAEPWWYGYSVGKWKATRSLSRPQGSLTSAGSTSEAAIDRSRESDGAVPAAQLRESGIEITVDDPKAYTKPWTVKVSQRIMPDTELIESYVRIGTPTHYVGAK